MGLPFNLPGPLASVFGSKPTSVTYYDDGPYAFFLSNASATLAFHGTEVPERLTSLGGNTVLAVHNFPGGIRTVQELGFFPAGIEFSGWLFSNPGHALGPNVVTNPITALARYQQIKSLCNSGGPFTLSYGGITLQGNVEKCEMELYNQFRIRYTIRMVITADLSNIANDQNEQNQLQQLQKWSNKMTAMSTNPSMPGAIGSPLALLQTGVQQVLLKYNVAGAADFANITNLASNLQGAITPYLTGANGSDSVLQSIALDAQTVVSGITTAAGTAISGVASLLPTINPNLFSVAQTTMGDSSQWSTIAKASGITDPQPIGAVTLTIPPPQPQLPSPG